MSYKKKEEKISTRVALFVLLTVRIDQCRNEASVTKLAPPPQSRQRKHRSLLNTMKNKGGNVLAKFLCAHYAMTYQILMVED